MTVHQLDAARRAQDEKAVHSRGPLGAIVTAPTEETACRRAALVLAQHRRGLPPADLDRIVLGLSLWATCHQQGRPQW